MEMSRRDLYKLGLVGTAPIALAACSGGSNLAGGAGDASKPTITAYTGGSGSLTENFNPLSATVLPMIQGQIYEPLFAYNIFKSLDAKPSPLLGESFSWNEEGTELTVKVRSGVTWSDGKPFTAKDVAFTFTTIKANTALNTAGGKTPSAAASDDTTVVLTYDEPSFPEAANALGRTWIIPEHVFSSMSDIASNTNAKPVGTGPFVLSDFTPQSYLLKPNNSYWKKNAVAIGGVRVISLSGNQSATDKWIAGEIDYMSTSVPDLDKLVKSKPNLAYVNAGTQQACLFAASNADMGCTGPQTDVAVRTAMYHAMDRDQLNKLAFFGIAQPASPSFALIERDKDFIDPSIQPCPQTANVAEAKKVLEAAGYALGSDGIYAKDGQRVSMTCKTPSGWTDYVTALDTLAQQFKAAGIELVPQQVSVNEWNDAKTRGDYQLVIDSLGQGPAPDPYYVYQRYYFSKNATPVGQTGNPSQNAARFADPEVDAAIEAAGATDDLEAKKKQYFLIQQKIAAALPYIPIQLSSGLSQFNTSKVKGWPTKDDLYANPAAWAAPDSAQVMQHLKPAS